MPNLYGVANAPALPLNFQTIGSSNIACSAGVETNIVDSGVLIAPSQGWFYPIVWMGVLLGCGATVPTFLNWNLRVNNGADQDTIGINTSVLVASGLSMWFDTLVGTPSQTLYAGAGSHVQVSCTPTVQAVTVYFSGTRCTIALYRAPDQ